MAQVSPIRNPPPPDIEPPLKGERINGRAWLAWALYLMSPFALSGVIALGRWAFGG